MEMKVNRAEWERMQPDERKKVEAIITNFFKGSTIVPDDNAKASGVTAPLGNPFCTIACNIAETAATAACSALGNPIAIAACVALAEAAGNACRDAC